MTESRTFGPRWCTCAVTEPSILPLKIFTKYVQLKKMNVIPLAIVGVKWPFSNGRGGR